MLDKYKLIGVVWCLFLSITSYAQQSVVVSSIGNFAGTTGNITAIQFKSISNCIDVQSGIAVLVGKEKRVNLPLIAR